MVFKFVDLLIILIICGQFLTDTNAKHRSHRFRCPVLKHCTKHKHKICGSDGINNILFDSHCHLRKASCEQGIQLKTVHRNKCDLANGAFDYEQHGSNDLIVDQTKQQHQIENENDQNRNLFNIENIDQLNNFTETNSQINLQQDNVQSKNLIEECKTEQYELMKYQLFQKDFNSRNYNDKNDELINKNLTEIHRQINELKNNFENIKSNLNELNNNVEKLQNTNQQSDNSILINSRFKNINQFINAQSESKKYGKIFYLMNIPWSVWIYNREQKYLGIYLRCEDNKVSKIKVMMKLRLLNHHHENKQLTMYHAYTKPEGYGTKEFIALNQLSDGYIQDNMIIVQVDLKIESLNQLDIPKPTGNSPCLITDLLQFEERNQNDLLDFGEIQEAFSKYSTKDTSSGTLDVNMVSLDESLSVNVIQTHLNDNIEIRCDIVGKPLQPNIKWFRNNVDLATLNIPNIKVFNDGLLYLSNVILAFAGNYTCQAENNSIIKQVHIVKVIMTPITKVTPHFHWSTIGSSFSVSCEYHCLFDQVHISWTKNDEPLISNQRITMLNNNTKLELSELSRSDTGAYTCRAYSQDTGSYSQDTVSLVVQDEPVSEQNQENFKSRLWIFHKNGVSIHSIGCSGLLHEMDARDFIPINGLTLCGLGTSTVDDQNKSAEDGTRCQWSENAILLQEKIYIGQPNLNRLIVFDTQHLSVSRLIATDPRPQKLWLVPGVHEQRIWILCYGNDLEKRLISAEERKIIEEDKLQEDGLFGKFDSNYMQIHQHNLDQYLDNEKDDKQTDSLSSDQFEWRSTSREQQLHNRKTIQILRLASNSMHNENVIHLIPIDGHFDLVYNLFVPKSVDEFHSNNVGNSIKNGPEFNSAQRYAYASHFDERRLIKIDMENFKYIKSIDLADCHPIDAVFTQFGLLIIQCETPITHQLNGQLILDQITDSIIEYNTNIKAHKTYLSPNEQFLISIYHNTSEYGAISSTIIVQRVKQSGLELLYDVKTTLIIVDCDFVWKNGNFDAILVSASANREDAIYLTLVDGKVELINGIGKPGKNLKRKISIKSTNKLAALTAEQSVFVINLKNNRVQCETDQTHQNPSVVIWT